MESQLTEYKKGFGKELIISLVAFSNTDGGKVVIGVEDNGKVCGIEIGDETLQQQHSSLEIRDFLFVSDVLSLKIQL